MLYKLLPLLTHINTIFRKSRSRTEEYDPCCLKPFWVYRSKAKKEIPIIIHSQNFFSR